MRCTLAFLLVLVAVQPPAEGSFGRGPLPEVTTQLGSGPRVECPPMRYTLTWGTLDAAADGFTVGGVALHVKPGTNAATVIKINLGKRGKLVFIPEN